jgi:hypothetical protein
MTSAANLIAVEARWTYPALGSIRVPKPRTGCWADMIAPFAEKMPGKRMPNSGKIGLFIFK